VQYFRRSKDCSSLRILIAFGAISNEVDKVAIISESNTAGIWGQNRQSPEANGGSGADPPTLRRYFTIFYQKYAFLSIFLSKFLLKMRF